MAQIITCPACKQQLQVPEEFLGQPVKCPGCGVAFTLTGSSGTSPAAPGTTPSTPIPPSALGSATMPPFGPWGEAPLQHGVEETRAAASLATPAVLLLIIGGFGLLCIGYAMLSAQPMDPKKAQELAAQVFPDNPEARDQLINGMQAAEGPFGTGVRLVFMLLSLIIVGGALAMLNRRMYPLAIMGSLAAMVYLNPCCCFFSFPIGLWALIVLVSADVRATFQ